MENNNKNEFVECENCVFMYRCQRTYLGGCTDGIEWDKKEEKDEE